jgi:hypothetical protein
LQAQQAGDHLHVVLDPVMDLAQQDIAVGHSIPEFDIAAFKIGGALGDPPFQLFIGPAQKLVGFFQFLGRDLQFLDDDLKLFLGRRSHLVAPGRGPAELIQFPAQMLDPVFAPAQVGGETIAFVPLANQFLHYTAALGRQGFELMESIFQRNECLFVFGIGTVRIQNLVGPVRSGMI